MPPPRRRRRVLQPRRRAHRPNARMGHREREGKEQGDGGSLGRAPERSDLTGDGRAPHTRVEPRGAASSSNGGAARSSPVRRRPALAFPHSLPPLLSPFCPARAVTQAAGGTEHGPFVDDCCCGPAGLLSLSSPCVLPSLHRKPHRVCAPPEPFVPWHLPTSFPPSGVLAVVDSRARFWVSIVLPPPRSQRVMCVAGVVYPEERTTEPTVPTVFHRPRMTIADARRCHYLPISVFFADCPHC
ncbi:hypothetical protein HPB50_005880 [Hyalomma asiaticum]|uniref:Uncharacterized protein n=1 Tax=Hyalomma asiaticum TaxID=266040 RepID=A0ACB7S7Y6_HYAAI|nr:hypothetical protein HPB50_005880 [Hyalomma asiaticum]